MTETDMPHLLTVEEAAAALHAKVTVSAIRAAIREGRLPASRIGKRYFIDPAALRRFARCPYKQHHPDYQGRAIDAMERRL